MSAFEQILEGVLTRWREEIDVVRGGVTTGALQQFEDHWQVVLPTTLRRYFRMVDGTGSKEADSELFSFWSLSELEPIRMRFAGEAEHAPDGLFAFADYFVQVHLYAVDLAPGPYNGSVWLVSSPRERRLVADGLHRFF